MTQHSDNHDHFDVATLTAKKTAMRLLTDNPPVVVADAFIGQGLAVWAADTGRHDEAEKFLEFWVAVRDA